MHVSHLLQVVRTQEMLRFTNESNGKCKLLLVCNVHSKILYSTCVALSLCIPHPADANVCFLKTKNLC